MVQYHCTRVPWVERWCSLQVDRMVLGSGLVLEDRFIDLAFRPQEELVVLAYPSTTLFPNAFQKSSSKSLPFICDIL